MLFSENVSYYAIVQIKLNYSYFHNKFGNIRFLVIQKASRFCRFNMVYTSRKQKIYTNKHYSQNRMKCICHIFYIRNRKLNDLSGSRFRVFQVLDLSFWFWFFVKFQTRNPVSVVTHNCIYTGTHLKFL